MLKFYNYQYSFTKTSLTHKSIASAFVSWAAVIALTFEEIDNYQTADIKIEFVSGEHGDGSPFDGKMGILSHAFAPEDGRFHLDSDEIWTVDMSRTDDQCAIDLETVAVHEIGHLIGLDHSNVTDSVMFPSIEARSVNRRLKPDDIEGARYLYGPSNHYTNMPKPQPYYTAASMAAPLLCSAIFFAFILSSILLLSS
jgi:predicted Zn-dependent protease